jgi:hypothetical protein
MSRLPGAVSRSTQNQGHTDSVGITMRVLLRGLADGFDNGDPFIGSS